MSEASRTLLRFLVVLFVLAMMAPAAGLLPRGGTPYRSALSTLGPSEALAAPGCPMQICDKPKGSKPADCLTSTLLYRCSKSGGHCTATTC